MIAMACIINSAEFLLPIRDYCTLMNSLCAREYLSIDMSVLKSLLSFSICSCFRASIAFLVYRIVVHLPMLSLAFLGEKKSVVRDTSQVTAGPFIA